MHYAICLALTVIRCHYLQVSLQFTDHITSLGNIKSCPTHTKIGSFENRLEKQNDIQICTINNFCMYDPHTHTFVNYLLEENLINLKCWVYKQ